MTSGSKRVTGKTVLMQNKTRTRGISERQDRCDFRKLKKEGEVS